MASPSHEVQALIFRLLRDNAAVSALVSAPIYDGVTDDAVHPYLSFGPSDFVPDDYDCISGRNYTFQVDIWTKNQNVASECREITDAVDAALNGATGDLGDHALITLDVVSGRVIPDVDEEITHGIVQVTAQVEVN